MVEFLKKLNWADILAIVLMLRICYKAVDKGLPTEAFKLLGTISAIYLSLHYYIRFGAYLGGKSASTDIVPDFFDLAAFCMLFAAGYFTFVILRKTFVREPKEGASTLMHRLGAIAMGVVRGLLLVSIIFYIFCISGVSYFKKSVADSYSGAQAVKAAPAMYDFLWNNLTSRFSAGEEHNGVVGSIKDDVSRNNQAK